jgi:hypothetical protein
MRHTNSVDTDRYGLDTRKGKVTMKEALEALQARLGSQRLAAQVDSSVMWTEEDKKGKK